VRVLFVDDRRSERDAMLKALPRATYQVEGVADEASAIVAMAREAPQVVVFAPQAKGGEDFVRKLRSFDATGQAYVLAVLDASPSQKEISGLLAAGVNDFMRRPLVEAELIERIKAPTRLLQWVRSVAKPAAFDFSAPLDIAQLKAWLSLGATVAEDLSQLVGGNLTATSGFPESFGTGLCAARIPMSLAENQLEVRIWVVADKSGVDWLRTAVLGDPGADDAAMADVLREFANTAGGALKRSALLENVTLTTGIPSSLPFTPSSGTSAWTLTLDGDERRLAIVAETCSKENQRVSAADLSEGMVVVHEVRSETGLLLVPAGSRLTSSTAAKLAKVLGRSFFVEVASAA
jgi:DNA-binding response OmpR family regulator